MFSMAFSHVLLHFRQVAGHVRVNRSPEFIIVPKFLSESSLKHANNDQRPQRGGAKFNVRAQYYKQYLYVIFLVNLQYCPCVHYIAE
jgi:hypothetical protein